MAQRRLASLSDCDPARLPRRHYLQRFLCYIRRLSDAYAIHQCSLLACACAYCALLSLVPLLIVGIAALGYVVGDSERVLNETLAAIRGFVPIDSGFMRDTLRHVLQDRGLIGLFGLLGLLYAAHQTFLALIPALNIIWVVPETRHWLRQRLIAVAATFYSLFLLAADLAASTLLAYLQSQDELAAVSDRAWIVTERAAFLLVPTLIITLLLALLYQFLPARRVPWKAAFLGAGVAALLWQATKLGFGVFLYYIHSYDRLYGSLSSLVILVIWAYYTMGILLLGAEIAADYESTRHGMRAAEARAHSGADLVAAHGTQTGPTPTETADAGEEAVASADAP